VAANTGAAIQELANQSRNLNHLKTELSTRFQ